MENHVVTSNTSKQISEEQMTSLSCVLTKLIESKGLELAEFCRKINVGYATMYQLVHGINLNPRIGTLLPVLKYFNISLEQLIGEEPLDQRKKTDSIEIKKNQHSAIWNNNLYNSCVSAVAKIADKKDRDIDFDEFASIVKEVYLYSNAKKLSKADPHFVKWFCQHHLA